MLLRDVIAIMLHLACHSVVLHLILLIQADIGTYCAYFWENEIVVCLMGSWDQILLQEVCTMKTGTHNCLCGTSTMRIPHRLAYTWSLPIAIQDTKKLIVNKQLMVIF